VKISQPKTPCHQGLGALFCHDHADRSPRQPGRCCRKETLPPPARLHQAIPLSQRASDTVHQARAALGRILLGQDPRLLVVVGPCSIHDIRSAHGLRRGA
jgi:3-deoxy-D-arabino-heptulosonate 7-phosphate (DAHP) synthase